MGGVPGSLAGNFEAFGPGPVVFVAPGGLHWRAVSRHVDDALDGGRDRAGPWDGDCGDARVLRRAACFAGSIHHFPGLDTLRSCSLMCFGVSVTRSTWRSGAAAVWAEAMASGSPSRQPYWPRSCFVPGAAMSGASSVSRSTRSAKEV